jgi:hypothetical protein
MPILTLVGGGGQETLPNTEDDLAECSTPRVKRRVALASYTRPCCVSSSSSEALGSAPTWEATNSPSL